MATNVLCNTLMQHSNVCDIFMISLRQQPGPGWLGWLAWFEILLGLGGAGWGGGGGGIFRKLF